MTSVCVLRVYIVQFKLIIMIITLFEYSQIRFSDEYSRL